METFRRLIAALLIGLFATSGLAATATDLIPSSAPRGARIIVRGTDLQTGELTLTFPDADTGTAATLHERAAKYAEVTVPASAITGGVRVTQGTSQLATVPFTVLPDPTFETVQTLLASDQAHDLLKAPGGIAIDPRNGTIFVADTRHHQIKTISAQGITVLAGSGQPGLSDGVGSAARFHEPAGLAFDAARQLLYVADSANHAIRRISLNGVVTTLAGSGQPGDRDGVGAAAHLKQPLGIAVDAAGTVFVADTVNARIKRITTDGTVTTIAGTGRSGLADGVALDARFAEPEGIAVDAQGALLIVDTNNHRLRRLTNGIVTTIAGSDRGFADGSPFQARFDRPRGIALDETDNIFLTDSGNDVIRKLGTNVTTIAGRVSTNNGQLPLLDGPALQAQFDEPAAIAIAGALLVADAGHDAIRIVLPHLTVSDVYPQRGPLGGGNQVRVFGNGFVPGRTTVTVGGLDAACIVVTSTELLITMPAQPAGPADIVITTPAGAATLTGRYTYLAPPTLISIAPAKGKTAGGQTATLRGTEFASGGTEILFGNAPAVAVTIDNPTSATVSTPANAPGRVDVIARTEVGEARLESAFRYFDPPAITSFTPLQARVGDTITISGQNFDSDVAGNVVTIGSAVIAIVATSPTQIVITVPPGAITGKLTVATAGGTVMSATNLVVLTYTSIVVAPATTSINPSESVQLTASGVLPSGVIEPLTTDVTWISSNPAIASVAADGTTQALTSGSVTISATYRGLSGSAAIVVRGTVPLPPDPATIAPPADPTIVSPLADEVRFLYSGPNAIQTGVVNGAFIDQRTAVFRGRVLRQNGLPHPGVTVSVLNHPEFGQTLTRADGFYDLVVNGGGPLTLRYERTGAIPAQRLVVSTWGNQKSVEDVVLVEYDNTVTTIPMLSGSVQIARGSVSTDADGSRRATLLFPANTAASLVMPNGSIQSISTLSIRATEFTVGATGPQAMPAALPPTSGYTYCVELSADEAVAAGATEVRFSKPVSLYVENFIGFPVGGIVPAGYYDRVQGAWISSNNGRVLKLLAIAGGAAQLDLDGNGLADTPSQLLAVGIDLAEQQKLATLYTPGQTLWRVPIPHLTPWDSNWPYGPPLDAAAPQQPGPDWIRPSEEPCRVPNQSTVDCHNQTLGEAIPINGTPFSLLYDSGRVSHSQYRVEFNVTGASVPPSVKRVEVQLEIAGRMFDWTFSPQPNLKQDFTWDGRDVYGRIVSGTRDATISVRYVYPIIYTRPGDWTRAWASTTGVPLGVDRSTAEIKLAQVWAVPLGHFDAAPTGFAGWTLSPHRLYDGRGKVLYDDDRNRAADPQATGRRVLNVVAGTGACCATVDGIRAVDSKLGPHAFAPTSDGGFYIAEGFPTFRIKRVSPNGIITTIAGNGISGFTADGQPALGNPIQPRKLAVGPDDTLYFTDTQFRVRRLTNGILKTVAGNGGDGTASMAPVDGKLATTVAIAVEDIAVGPDGTLYLAEGGRLTAVGLDGIMRRIAGGGGFGGNSGDGGPAINASIVANHVAVGNYGDVYFSYSTGGQVIRKIDASGIIRRVAGGGVGSLKDGAHALSGSLLKPTGLTVASDGTILVAENGPVFKIRSIAPDGIVTTLAGTGAFRHWGRGVEPLPPNGVLARTVGLDFLASVRTAPDGTAMIHTQNVILKTDPSLPEASSTSIIASSDGAAAFVFEHGRHTRTVDAMTGVVLYRFEFDGHGFVTSVTDADGNITRIERSADGLPTAIVAPGGQRTTLEIRASNLVTITNPAQQSQEFTYQGPLMSGRRDPRGGLSQYHYDELGRLTDDQDPAGGSIRLVRTGGAEAYTVTRTSAEGRVHQYNVNRRMDGTEERFTVDPKGLATHELMVDGLSTTDSPDGTRVVITTTADPRFGTQAPVLSSMVQLPSGLGRSITRTRSVVLTNSADPLSLTSLTDRFTINGRTFTTLYDAAARTQTSTSPMGRTTTAQLTNTGQLASRQVPGLASTNFEYNENGLPSRIVRGPRILSFEYNERREVTSITDSLSRTARFVYDDAGRVTRQMLPDGRVIAFSYDPAGNLASLTPLGRPTHGFNYTPVNLTSEYISPANAAVRYEYNKDRQLTLVTRADDQTIGLNYDSSGRIATLTAPHGVYGYGYSATTGTLSAITTPDGSALTFSYDGPLLTRESWSGPVSGSVSWSHDTDFRLVNENGEPYQYDPDGLLTAAGAMTLTRNAQNGLLTGTTLGSVNDNYTYNAFGEVITYSSQQGGASLLSFAYTRDAAGRISAIGSRGFEYDLSGRLARVTESGVPIAEYDYDSNGNRIAHRYLGGSTAATYDSQDRMLSYGDTSFGYSEDGELKTKVTGGQATTFDYDVLGNLRSVAIPGRRIDYVTDGRNRRIGKRIDGVLICGWLYGDQLRIVAELDGSGAVISRFVYGSRGNVPDFIVRAGVTYRILSDHLGSPRLVVNTATGAVAQRLDFDEFGNVLVDSNPGFQPFGFAGGLYDRDTGLVRFGARDYDPSTGRWTTLEPLGFRGGDANLYSYVGNDPVNWVDPSGLIKIRDMHCADLLSELNRLTDELAERAAEERGIQGDLLGGQLSRPNIENIIKYWRHRREYEAKQRRVKKLLDEFDRRPCKPDITSGRRDFATEGFPDDKYLWDLWGQTMMELLLEGPPRPDVPFIPGLPGFGPMPYPVPIR